MDLLIKWVTQIIVFIIVAIIVDMIIPQNAMKKYIKLVVGLILILILLKPVFTIFHANVTETIESSFSKLLQDDKTAKSMENSIKMQKKEIQGTKHAYILEEMAVQLKKLVNKDLAERYQHEITNLQFTFASDEEPAWDELEQVIVYLGQTEKEEGAVRIVEDIDINMNKPVEDEEGQDVQDIKNLLSDRWEIDESKLTIAWEGGSS